MTDQKSVPRMHHYLPRFYLNGFSQKNKLTVIDFESDKTFVASPQNVAKVRDFYAFESITSAIVDYSVETELFQAIDSDAAGVITKINETCCIPTGHDWEALCWFIASLEVRVPRFRQIIYEFEQYKTDVEINSLFGTPESFDSFKKSYETGTGESLGVSYDEVKEIMESSGVLVQIDRNSYIEAMLKLMPSIYDIASKMTPHLLVVSQKAHFVTSDSPVVKYNNYANELGTGWLAPDIEVAIPLTYRCCLVLDRSGKPKILQAHDFGVANSTGIR